MSAPLSPQKEKLNFYKDLESMSKPIDTRTTPECRSEETKPNQVAKKRTLEFRDPTELGATKCPTHPFEIELIEEITAVQFQKGLKFFDLTEYRHREFALASLIRAVGIEESMEELFLGTNALNVLLVGIKGRYFRLQVPNNLMANQNLDGMLLTWLSFYYKENDEQPINPPAFTPEKQSFEPVTATPLTVGSYVFLNNEARGQVSIERRWFYTPFQVVQLFEHSLRVTGLQGFSFNVSSKDVEEYPQIPHHHSNFMEPVAFLGSKTIPAGHCISAGRTEQGTLMVSLIDRSQFFTVPIENTFPLKEVAPK